MLAATTSAQTTSYLYGDVLLGQKDASGWSYRESDGLGNTVGASDASGDASASASYDAFGALTSGGTPPSSFMFAGVQLDTESGLYYQLARYYDPSIGRFLTPDTSGGLAGDTQGLDRYVYCENDPPNVANPSRNMAGTLLLTRLLTSAQYSTYSQVQAYAVGTYSTADDFGSVEAAWQSPSDETDLTSVRAECGGTELASSATSGTSAPTIWSQVDRVAYDENQFDSEGSILTNNASRV